MKSSKQPAFTNHPKGMASVCLRVGTRSGGRVEFCTERPLPAAVLIELLERDYIPALKRLTQPSETQDKNAVFASSEGTERQP